MPEARITVGRDESCDIRVQSEYVSGLHAILTYDGRHWSIQDAGSTNGVRVNSQRVYGLHRIAETDRVEFSMRDVLTGERLMEMAQAAAVAQMIRIANVMKGDKG
jgi:pSer/pThr/pTyr-binding forkhead associated (FHA) protein